MTRKGITCQRTRAGQDLQHAGWQPGVGFVDGFCPSEQGQGRPGSRLGDDRAPCGEGGGDGAQRQLKREVPGHDVGGDPERLAEGVVETRTGNGDRGTFDFIGEACKVFQRPCTVADFREGFPERLAVVRRFNDGEFLCFAVGDRSHFVENTSTLSGVHGFPVCIVQSGT